MLRSMMLIRAFEQALARRNDHGFQLLSSGEEAVAVGLCSALTGKDQLLTGGRSIGPALARGLAPDRVMAELLGRSSGTNRGKGGQGSSRRSRRQDFSAPMRSSAAISALPWALRYPCRCRQAMGLSRSCSATGRPASGALHESLNIAAIWNLPVLFVCNNNQFSVSTPRAAALAPKNISDLGVAFGMPSRTIDGMDVELVADVAREAVEKIRAGSGPQFLECISYRFSSHSTTARETRTREELASIRSLCPIERHMKAPACGRHPGQGAARPASTTRSPMSSTGALAFADASEFPDPAEVLTDVW